MTRGELKKIADAVVPLEDAEFAPVQRRLDDLTKPPGSLGRLEEAARRLAAIQGTVHPRLARKRICTLAGDHGVTREGVSAYPAEVTSQMVLNFLSGGAAINVLARHVGAEVLVADLGVDFDFSGTPGLLDRKVARGTQNFTRGPAMTETEALAAVAAGMGMADDAVRDGVDLLGVGEMGIGNTTSASAMLAAFSGLTPEETVGRGTGVDDAGLMRKADAVRRGLDVNSPDPADALDVLAKVGGLEIAGMTGLYLGAARRRIPVVADGFISTAAALAAVRLCPAVTDFLFLSHLSHEQAHHKMVGFLGIRPLLSLDLRLGEGTGAALAMTILEGSAKILSEMATFGEAGVTNRE